MAELTLLEAINDCFHVELGRDENVMVMGEDVGRAGGVFRATAGLRDKFGADRCVDTPLAEAGILVDGIDFRYASVLQRLPTEVRVIARMRGGDGRGRE